MNRDEFLYLAPYLTSLLITLGVFTYTWRHRRVRGADLYLWFVGGQALTIFGFIFELVSPSLEIKILWDMFQWITETIIVILAFFIFATEYTERKFKHPKLVWSLVLIPPLALILLLLTDSIYHQIYLNPRLGESYPFKILEYDFTTFIYVYALLFVYLVPFYGIGLLIHRAFKSNGRYRAQFLVLALGFSVPILFSILALFNITIGPQRDISPLTFAVGNIIVALGLFRYGLFDLIPIAREKIMENMADPMIVLDVYDRVVDINQAALKKTNKKYSEVEGSHAKVALSEWPVVQGHLESIQEQTTNIKIRNKGENWFYELSTTPLVDNKKRLLGHVIVVHDITRHKTLEDGYKQLSEELEERVEERTQELAEAYDTTLEGWARALELRDKETEGHSRRVTESTLKVARAMDISGEDLVHIRRGAILHDIGKMGIPDEILRKQGPLTEDEREIVNQHPQVAYDLLFKIPYLKKALEIPYCHHEKWDGTGYPRGLKESEIPLTARIFAITDVWDALSYDRSYRNAWDKGRVIQYLRDESGKHFDPEIVQTFLELLDRGEI